MKAMNTFKVTPESLLPPAVRPVLRRLWRQLRGRPLDAWDLTGGRVASGPFRGMRYGHAAIGSVLSAKLIGSYERELHPWVDEIIATPYRTIHVVGCAEGYYAVGLARAMPHATVIAYDLDPHVPTILADMAARNGVAARVHFGGPFVPASLADPPAAAALIVCDVEGAEASLLDPTVDPRLLRCDLLVEIHDALTGSIESVIQSRFTATHRIRRVAAERRTGHDLPLRLRGVLTNDRAEQMMNERRKRGLSWLLMQRRDAGSGRRPGDGSLA
jgi:hypothetical protein